MSNELHDTIDELLARADAAGAAVHSQSAPDEGDTDGHSVAETAREARTVLESNDPADVLEAIGFPTPEVGDGPGSIPEAIVQGDADRVADLRRLVDLAALDRDTPNDDLDDVATSLRASIESKTDASTDESTTETASDDSPEETAAEPDDSSVEDDSLGEQLTTKVSGELESFRDDISNLSAATDDLLDDEDEDSSVSEDDAADEESDDDLLDLGSDEDEEDDDLLDLGSDEDEEDDDLLDLGMGDGLGSNRASRLSTVASSPSKRADMHAVRRHSTVPKKR